MLKSICVYFFIFQLYSIAGWIMETMLYILRDKHYVKRGFLYGPLCPIYGVGAVICTLILYNRISNIFLLFLVGMLLCGALEYITHFLMEKLFHAMWWDYSDRRLNIKGRVYLKGLLIFGVGAVLIVKVLQPAVFLLVDIMPDKVLYIICFALYTVFIIDLAVTLTNLMGIIALLERMQKFIAQGVQKGIDNGDEKINSAIDVIKSNATVNDMISFMRSNNLINRIREKYPDISLEKYKHIIDYINDKPNPGKARHDIKLHGTVEDTMTDTDTDDK